ncbi:hypothetical protein [Nocardia sp. NPDC057668]|uniref:hypothetical protein n=1 Tax=Nocardia sp. NPDC057668 TaxID=3346202 RepID=UPI0036711E84
MTASGSELLGVVAALPAPARMAAIAGEARRLVGRGQLDPLLESLWAGGRYERRIAIQMALCGGARDFLLARVQDPDPEFAARALSASIRLGVSADVVVRRLPVLSRWARKGVYRALSRGDRAQVADALLAPVRELYGDVEAARLLVYCSPTVVAGALGELAYAVPSWKVLSARHIGVVFEYVRAAAETAGRDEWRELWPRLTAHPLAAAEHDSAELLALAARAIAYVPVGRLHSVAGLLARRDPEAVFTLLRNPNRHGRDLMGPALWRAMLALPDDRLRELYVAAAPRERARFLRRVPPARRTAVAGAQLTRPGIAPGVIDLAELDTLPRRDRAVLARELLARPGGADVPGVADRLTARLPWEEAKPVLLESIRRPDADDRAIAYPLLVTAAVGSRDPGAVGDLLELLRRLRNEQDPVRRCALRAVAAIPMSLLAAEHVPALEQLAVDGLDARDRSHETSSAVRDLVRTLLIRGAQTGETDFTAAALRLIARLAELMITIDVRGLHRNLPRGIEIRLFEALRPRLEADADRGSFALALDLADGLEVRGYGIDGLRALLLRACTTTDDSTVKRAVRLALEDRATRDACVGDLLRRDRSLIARWEVQDLLSWRRTDLLDAVLTGPNTGRFLARDVRFVPMFAGGFERWMPSQIELYAGVLADYATHPKVSIGERAMAVAQLGLLPGCFDRVLPFLASADLTVAESALTALGRSDEPERAIALLSEQVRGDLARVTVSGIASRARYISPPRLATVLEPLLDSPKITAMKEGLRLLAVLRAPGAAAIIRECANRPGTHRDVRRAAVHATRFLFDEDETWQLLAELATDPEVADAILDIAPSHLPTRLRFRFAGFVRELAASADHRVAAQALSALAVWYPWLLPSPTDIRVDRLTDLTEVGLWSTAAHALLTAASGTGDPAPLVAALERLLAQTNTDFPDRDLPARQRIAFVLNRLVSTLCLHEHTRPIGSRVCALLLPDPLWHEQVIELTFAATRWTEIDATVAAVRALAPIATGALTDCPARQPASRSTTPVTELPPAALESIASALAPDPDPATALTATALIAQCGRHFGWSPPWTTLLTTLRAHPAPDVRRAAHAVFTAPE